jgi:hypothetical protein
MASNLPNTELMRKTLKGKKVTQQEYENAIKNGLWMHFEKMIGEHLKGETTKNGT